MKINKIVLTISIYFFLSLNSSYIKAQSNDSSNSQQTQEYSNDVVNNFQTLSRLQNNSYFRGDTWKIGITPSPINFTSLPVWTTTSAVGYVSNNNASDLTVLGSSFELNIYPYYGEYYGIGVISDIDYGYLDPGGSSTSTCYDFGVSAYAGFDAIRLLLRYRSGDRTGIYSLDLTSDEGVDETTTGEGDYQYKSFGIGLEYGGYSDNAFRFYIMFNEENSNYASNNLTIEAGGYALTGGPTFAIQFSPQFPVLNNQRINQNSQMWLVKAGWAFNFFGSPY
jgi:hypothetical protein